jgi:hypothetical protein
MMKSLFPSLLVLLLSTAGPARAYYFGEKPLEESVRPSGTPAVLRFTQSFVEFSTTGDHPVRIAVVDIRGRYVPIDGAISITVYPRAGYGSARIAMENLPSGPYFLTLTNAAGTTAYGFAGIR